METINNFFKVTFNVYFCFKLGAILSSFVFVFILLYMPPAHLKDVLNTGCGTTYTCTLEALARVLDGRMT